MKQVNYWIWLQRALGPAADLDRVLGPFDGNPRTLYETLLEEQRPEAECSVLTPNQYRKLKEEDLAATQDLRRTCLLQDIELVTPDSPDYPPLLRQLRTYPAVLYAKGDLRLLTAETAVAIVGTRNPVRRAREAAAELAGALTKAGVLVVSGGALGVDSAAHCGALNAGGPTAAVLGSGIGAKYLGTNAVLRELIAERGVVLTEYEPGTEPGPGFFPKRNRILAGMTCATVVVESGVKGGSLVTAKYAMEFNRTVMAVPFADLGSAARGSEELLQAGAPAVHTPYDVVAELQDSFGGGLAIPEEHTPAWDELVALLGTDITKDGVKHFSFEPDPAACSAIQAGVTPETTRKPELPDGVSAAARTVYACFDRHPLSIEQLQRAADLPVSRLLGALSELELVGCLTILPDRNYYFKQDGTIHG